MNDRSGTASIEAGAGAGIAGLVVFLVLHHLWIVPIWFIAPVGVVMAAAGGAAVGAAYGELRPHLPRRPFTIVTVVGLIAVVLAPSVVIAELRGPIYVMDRDGRTLLVPATQAVADFVVGLLGTSSLMGLVLGWLIGRNRRAAGTMALAAFALALGPGHNIPLLGGTGAVAKELLVLAAVTAVASLVLVEGEAWRAQRVTDTRQQQFRCRSKASTSGSLRSSDSHEGRVPARLALADADRPPGRRPRCLRRRRRFRGGCGGARWHPPEHREAAPRRPARQVRPHH